MLTASVGVLTKPDTILHGEEDGWIRVLEGSSHQLKRNSDSYLAYLSSLTVFN
jgi:hypothetical protein